MAEAFAAPKSGRRQSRHLDQPEIGVLHGRLVALARVTTVVPH
jgi:hypothetical protein